AGYEAIEEMRIQRQPVGLTEGEVQVIVDDPAVAVDACRSAVDVAHPREHRRDRTRGDDRIGQVAGSERHPVERESGGVVERRQVARIVEQAAREEGTEATAAERV